MTDEKTGSYIQSALRAIGDVRQALDLLMKAKDPKEILSGEHPETALLLAAREQVKLELEAARRVPPKVKGEVALIRFHSPCQIHPLVVQAWRGRLRSNIVIDVRSMLGSHRNDRRAHRPDILSPCTVRRLSMAHGETYAASLGSAPRTVATLAARVLGLGAHGFRLRQDAR